MSAFGEEGSGGGGGDGPTTTRHHYPALISMAGEGFPRLKKAVEQSSFVKYVVDDYVGKGDLAAQERMRLMDKFFLHNPHPEEECALLNLPNNRLHLHSLKDIMYLSGGLVGVRFDGEELREVSNICKRLCAQWAEIDRLYKAMTPTERKIVKNESLEPLNRFHRCCDDYLLDIKQLQQLVSKKQGQIDVNSEGLREIPKLDADPESKVGSQYPLWYSVLKDKYIDYLKTMKDAPDIPKFTLGKFAVFLSSCVHGPITCTPEEQAALSELQEASMDNVAIFMPQVHVTSANILTDPQRKYWAHRFFNFLKAVPELKSTVKDEKAVEAMSLW